MRKIFVILFLLLIIALPVFAGDDYNNDDGIDSLMKSSPIIDNAFNGQKKITDEQFQQALDQVKAKHNKKNKKNKPFAGSNYNEENTGGYLNETADKNLLLSVPLCLTNGDGTEIPTGHYKIVGKKVDNQPYLDFYQSSTLVAHVPAIETQSDFDQKSINFVQLMPYNEQRIKIIYGSMDFNAYTFIRIKKEISDQN